MYTVEQVAAMLELHPRTIRRYIREGRLSASKVGGEWRMREEDVDAFAGGIVLDLHERSKRDIESFLNGDRIGADERMTVCSVLDGRLEPQEAADLSQRIVAIMNEDDASRGQAKFQYMYLNEEKKSRFIIWGNPSFVGKLLSEVGRIAGT
ncbi:helix-turn-helix domain-containing protein [Paenibacillus sp. GYB003]|uniref:helix-turn-helix domain-containing protein n=1 Tax=Paenibacillus sp. GYB003 TaxID=2994392 RepID=UPI002F96DD37